MKIKEVTSESITFDNGNKITFHHERDCCERNYADFEQLDDLARNYDYDENLMFESVENAGFRFGSHPNRMFFVPCYSEQNGYYSTDIDIYYNGEQVLNFGCEGVFDW